MREGHDPVRHGDRVGVGARPAHLAGERVRCRSRASRGRAASTRPPFGALRRRAHRRPAVRLLRRAARQRAPAQHRARFARSRAPSRNGHATTLIDGHSLANSSECTHVAGRVGQPHCSARAQARSARHHDKVTFGGSSTATTPGTSDVRLRSTARSPAALFTTQPARHNEFNVNLAFVEAKLDGQRVARPLALQAGTSVQSNYWRPECRSTASRSGGIWDPRTSGSVRGAQAPVERSPALLAAQGRQDGDAARRRGGRGRAQSELSLGYQDTLPQPFTESGVELDAEG